jgi:transcriptional regulator with XRE-family HTH domain
MKYNFTKIGDRLRDLRKKNGYSQEKLLEILDTEYGFHISRNVLSNIENGCQNADNFKLGLLFALSDIYGCDVGYLLCEYDNITGRNFDIQVATGLNDASIKTLESLQQTDENEKAAALSPQQISLIDTLNQLLKEPFFTEPLIRDFRQFLTTRYSVPVYLDEEKRNFVYPNNDYSYTGDCQFSGNTIKGDHIINLASSVDEPNDNAPLYITDGFLESVALKSLENDFLDIKAAYGLKKGSEKK